MIPRYSRPEMAALWSEEAKLAHWLEIEVLACEGMAHFGHIPAEDAQIIRAKAAFDIARVRENERRTNHDVIAFLEEVATHVGGPGRFIHRGLTSSDLLDTTLALQSVASANLLLEDLGKLRAAIAVRALEHKFTPMMGRSHGIHAEPITYGLKLALMYDEFGRAEKRLVEARDQIAVGKLSGAVGTHAHLDPRVEEYVCAKLGLKAADLSTQVIQRDRHAHFISTLALIATSIDRWATEFRHLQRTEVLEVEEFFAEGQKGSSAMPHKRNPITGEKLSGLARVIRGHAVAALENVALWHERDISHSSVERIIFPDSCELLSYMLKLTTDLVARQIVYPENMRANLEKSKGLIFSQTVLLALADKGLPRQAAYEAVQAASMKCWRGDQPLPFYLKQSSEIRSVLSEREIDELCSPERHFSHVDATFKKLGLEYAVAAMPNTYVTAKLTQEKWLEALTALPAVLREILGECIFRAEYGWGCKLHPNLCHREMDIGLGWLDRFIADSLRQEIVIPGKSDFLIIGPNEGLEILFCHEGDIHSAGIDVEFQRRLWSSPPFSHLSLVRSPNLNV